MKHHHHDHPKLSRLLKLRLAGVPREPLKELDHQHRMLCEMMDKVFEPKWVIPPKEKPPC